MITSFSLLKFTCFFDFDGVCTDDGFCGSLERLSQKFYSRGFDLGFKLAGQMVAKVADEGEQK